VLVGRSFPLDLAELRFPAPELLDILGGERVMIESPLIQKLIAKRLQAAIIEVLKDRFGAVPKGVTQGLESILNEKKLTKLTVFAASCPDIEAFRERLVS
jgi:hypothetical protein